MSKLKELLSSEMPSYTLTLPSNSKKVKYRPFTVKEEKVLLMAVEDGRQKNLTQAIIDVIENCCGDIKNAGDIPMIDLEYLFLRLRAKSIGEKISPIITCPHTGERIQQEINLLDIDVQKDKNTSNKIKISDNLGITLKYPTANSMSNENLDNDEYDIETVISVVANSIEEIWADDKIYKSEDLETEDLVEFVEALSPDQFEQVNEFFENLPKLNYELEYTTKDGEERKITLSGIVDFFG